MKRILFGWASFVILGALLMICVLHIGSEASTPTAVITGLLSWILGGIVALLIAIDWAYVKRCWSRHMFIDGLTAVLFGLVTLFAVLLALTVNVMQKRTGKGNV